MATPSSHSIAGKRIYESRAAHAYMAATGNKTCRKDLSDAQEVKASSLYVLKPLAQKM
jgi:hypothetical protein